MSSQALDDCKNLGVRSRILHKTLGQKLYPKLNATLSPIDTEHPQWRILFDDYFSAAKQLDELSHEMKSVFGMLIPVPRKPQNPVTGEFSFTIPQILSTMVPHDDKKVLKEKPLPDIFRTQKQFEHAEKSVLAKYNDKVDGILGHFNLLVDGYKQEHKQRNQDSHSRNSKIVAIVAPTVQEEEERKKKDVHNKEGGRGSEKSRVLHGKKRALSTSSTDGAEFVGNEMQTKAKKRRF